MNVMDSEVFYDKYIAKDFESYHVPKCFEDICRQYLVRLNRKGKTDEIFEKVWNDKVYEANNTVMVHIRRLRGKMKDDTRTDKIITTVWGVGYKIEQ